MLKKILGLEIFEVINRKYSSLSNEILPVKKSNCKPETCIPTLFVYN